MPEPTGAEIFFSSIANRERRANQNVSVAGSDPTKAAQANAMGRQLGLPGDTVERNFTDLRAQVSADRATAIINRNSGLAAWFADPRAAAASTDSIDHLDAISSVLGRSSPAAQAQHRATSDMLRRPAEVPLTERLSAIRAQEAGRFASIEAARPRSTPGSWWTGTAIGTVEGFKQDWIGAQRYMSDTLGFDALREDQDARYRASVDRVAAATPRDMSRLGEAAYGGIISLGQSVPTLVASVFGGLPVGLAVAGSQTGAQAYGKYSERGATKTEALLGGTLEGGIEAGTELLPLAAVTKRFGKTATGRLLGEFLLKDMAGEQVATFGQDAVDTAIANPDATWSQFWKDRPGAAFDTAVAVGIASGAVAGAHHAAKALAPVERDLEHATSGIAGAALLDRVMTSAADTPLRQHDPEAFRQFVEQQAAGSPVERVYVPAEKLRELMQSDGYEPGSFDWQPDFEEQIGQALATGGDVVLPIAGVAAHLAGTPTWEVIKSDARLSPGGLSEREADEFNAAFADIMAEQGRRAAETMRAEAEQRAPERKVYDDVFTQVRQAGFNVRAAQAYADLFTSRYVSRAERTGTDAFSAYKLSNLSIRQHLAEAITSYRKADSLDLLINAMRRGAEEQKPSGPSLLEFIAQNGGVEDRGGDIASMGGDKWHREKAFRRKLIRSHPDDRQSGMMGAVSTSTGYGLDDLARKAWEAGYFPNAVERPTVSDLLEAIGSELRGNPVHAEGAGSERARETQENVSQAADELRRVLDEAGLDPETASRSEIDEALERFDSDRSDLRSLNQSARGRIELFGDGSHVINLFEGRDLSTLLHEGGHLFLEELWRDAGATEATDQIKADQQAVIAWFAANGHAIGEDGVIPTEAHELWARGFERYLLEGKAPTSALRSAFAAFRSWLLRIYQLVGHLNSNITPEVRQVMDRLVATDEAIAAASAELEEKALPQDALGMTDAEYSAYRGTVDATRTDAFDALLYRTMGSIRRARTKEWRDERAGVRRTVADEIASRPEFKPLSRLRGKGEDRIALDRTAIVEEYGAEALALIPKGVPPTVVATGGVHPDILAEAVGLNSGQELMDRLMGVQQRENELGAAGDKRSAFDEAADIQADAIMRERHGDPLADGSIEEEALAAIHSDTRATVLEAELRALSRRSTIGQRPTPLSVAKGWASKIVREGLITEQASAAALARHQRVEVKAGRAAEKAILAGDIEQAFAAKQQQLLNHALYRAAKDAKDDVDAIVRRLGKLAKAKTLPSMDQEYLDRIHDLLAVYDLKRRSARELAERESFSKWVAAREAEGVEVHYPQRLQDAGRLNFTKLAYDDLTALDDTVASIAHLGRAKKKLTLAAEHRDFDDAVEQFVAGAQNIPGRRFTADRNQKATKLGKLGSWARSFNAEMVKIEFVADELDNHDPNGVMNKLLVQGSTRAANEKADLTERVLGPLSRLYLDMPREHRRRLQERVPIPEFVEINPETMEVAPSVFSRMDLLAIALNTGSESNLDKMIRGESLPFRQMPQHRWTQAKVEAVLARELRAEDWKFVEAVWRQIDQLWPDIVRAEKEIIGVAPEKVEARRVMTPYGEIEGGYYPVVYDPARSIRAADNYADDAEKLLGQMGRAVSTPKGHTVERTQYAAPLLLAVEPVLLNHVRRVTTRIAYGAWIRDALKFTDDARVRSLIDRKLGPEYHRQIRTWLRGQVNEAALDTATLRGIDGMLRKARVNATMVGLGFRLTTMVAQLGGLANSANEVGPTWLARGMGEAVANAGSIRDFVFARSPEMMRRAQDFDRDIATAFRDMAGSSKALDRFRAMAFWGIGMIDVNLVAIPTWLGAYRRALSEGMTEKEAAALGDKAVRKSQGAGRAKDLAAIQNASEGYRVLTTFYSYFSVQYNKQWESIRALRSAIGKAGRADVTGAAHDAQRAAMTVWWVMIAGPLLSALLTGDWPQDEESWPEWATRKMFFGLWAGVPGVRDMAAVMERKVSGQFVIPPSAPLYRAWDSLLKVLTDGAAGAGVSDQQLSDRWIRHTSEFSGYFLNLPTGQVGATADYAYAVAVGQQRPATAGEVVKGVVKGRQRDQE